MSKLFFGGIPTKPDVDRLMASIDPVQGTAVDYETIASIAQCEADSNRFHTIMGAWRKRLFKEANIQTAAEGKALHFLTAEEALSRGITGIQHIGRAIGRVHVRTASIDATQLPDKKRQQHMIVTRESRALLDAARSSAKQIAAPKPVQSPLKLPAAGK